MDVCGCGMSETGVERGRPLFYGAMKTLGPLFLAKEATLGDFRSFDHAQDRCATSGKGDKLAILL
jgi:hypothetical protein